MKIIGQGFMANVSKSANRVCNILHKEMSEKGMLFLLWGKYWQIDWLQLKKKTLVVNW